MNLSLLALTVSDLCSLLPLYWLGVMSDPHFRGPAVLYVGLEAQFLTASWPHTIFARLTSWLTAYIMLERCFCVALPLKVKVVVTPRRVKAVLITLYAVVLAGVLPTYTTHGLAWRFYPAHNLTMLGLSLSDSALSVTRVTNIITNPLSAISSFAVVLACTVIIATTLSRKARWRESNSVATANGQYHITGKARKAVKMVTILSVIFLISVTPSVISVILTDVSTDFSLTGKYRNIFYVVYSITFILEAVNSCSNFFVYYTMNSKFKSMFHQLFVPKWMQQFYPCRMKAI
ncbi:FMRFamide receptor-like [Physella acuta]|uniref:FMRFamide receptor-like n=1 Tax=Physella acuta TaxID=109671 RepID=UPI0027DB4D67|nr:FMRFamide receptor-like [Physella acuta]